MYPDKFILQNVVAPFLRLSVVNVTLPLVTVNSVAGLA